MIRIIKFLITGSWHSHEYETVTTDKVNSYGDNGEWSWTKTDYIQRCKSCGKMRKYQL